jgi:hypothetical protein
MRLFNGLIGMLLVGVMACTGLSQSTQGNYDLCDDKCT